MIEKQVNKFAAILANFTNGNLKDAAKQVRNLSKAQIASLLIEWHQYAPELMGEKEAVNNWERFILLALENYYV